MKYAAFPLVFFGWAQAVFGAVSSPLPLPSSPSAVTQAAPKIVSAGSFRDSSGAAHAWSITPAHTLQWEGAAYIPVGGVFLPQSWADGATDADWTADQKTLSDWKTHGVLDICLSAGQVGLTHVPPGRVQRVLDFLDANGFRYGLEIADFPKDPLIGYVIKPGVYRDAAPPAVGPARFGPIPGLADAFYMLVSRHDGEVDGMGQAQVVAQDTAVVNLQNGGPDDVLLLYPQRFFLEGSPESRLPDLWQGYDEYRDRLLAFFRGVKFGPGFRFFLDPLTERLGLGGDYESIVPTTDGFRLDFQAWLDRKYQHNVNDLNQGWGIADRSTGSAIPDFVTAARSIPLWFGARGVPTIYDPVGHVSYGVTNKPRIGGHFWEDLNDFRLESTRGYMNAVADALQKGVADVPVVYQWTGHNALFTNDRTSGGYDGLSLGASDSNSVLNAGAYVYAQAEESRQTNWVLAGDIGGTPARPALFAAWDSLRDIGARGFFLPSPSGEALDWLNAYAAGAQVSAGALAAAKPRILPYPSDLGLGLTAQRLPSGVWWLPSYRPGSPVSLGASLHGYVMPDPAGRLPTYVVWAPDGKTHVTRFGFPKDSQPFATDAAGNILKIDKKGDEWTIPIGADPVLISHVRSLPLPLDAADEAEKEAQRLLAMAESQNIDTERLKQQLFYAGNNPAASRDAGLRYDMTEHVVAALTALLRPYAWIEGESAAKYTFDSISPDPDASGGAYLSLDTVLAPPHAAPGNDDGGYRAEYTFTVNAPGRYTVWMAGASLGTPQVSDFRYSIDSGVPSEIHAAPAEGGPYAGKFAWSNLGDVTLDSGAHKLTIVVLGHRPADNHYTLAIDAFCLSRVPFHPDGPHQPPISTLSPPTSPTAKPKPGRQNSRP